MIGSEARREAVMTKKSIVVVIDWCGLVPPRGEHICSIYSPGLVCRRDGVRAVLVLGQLCVAFWRLICAMAVSRAIVWENSRC